MPGSGIGSGCVSTVFTNTSSIVNEPPKGSPTRVMWVIPPANANSSSSLTGFPLVVVLMSNSEGIEPSTVAPEKAVSVTCVL